MVFAVLFGLVAVVAAAASAPGWSFAVAGLSLRLVFRCLRFEL